ncbi:hypothetical protein [Streptomyces sp. BA2]|uniref:hypothetical protein n=1 Tax=Streptomyces sp. BA2 TaxID=436595 RepID=UPI0013211FEF|nr:hypothetical protein [Streptomyces sp. BA2]MWA10450.1 hypothetical protein [Streptomyces sp. BA2]
MAPHLRNCRAVIATAIATALLTPIPATAARASAVQRAPFRTARGDPALAAQLSRDIRAALVARRGTVSVALHDPATGLSCALGSSRRYDTASVAKVMIMEAALRRAQDWGRGLSHDHPTTQYVARTIERVSQAVHRALNKGRAAVHPARTGRGQPVKIGHERVSGRRKLS